MLRHGVVADDDVPIVTVRFALEEADDGWPPVTEEEVRAEDLGGGRYRLLGIPFFAVEVAKGDIVTTEPAHDGRPPWVVEQEEWSGSCTIRVIPLDEGRLQGSLKAALRYLGEVGAVGEADDEWGLVAVDVMPDTDWEQVHALLVAGSDDGWWDYEEGCVDDRWLAL